MDTNTSTNKILQNNTPVFYTSRLIIKYNGRMKNYSPIYIMGNKPDQCIHAGILLNDTIEAFREIGIIEQVPHTEIIEKYFTHYGFLADCKNCVYYEIITNQTSQQDIQSLDYIYQHMRFQYKEDPKTDYMTNFWNVLKKMKRSISI